MTDIKSWLETCPYIATLQLDTVGPGIGIGLFPQGVQRTVTDILGNIRAARRYILRRRGIRGENWSEQVTLWLMTVKPPEGWKVLVSGGKLRDPAGDGAATYELELTVEYPVSADCL